LAGDEPMAVECGHQYLEGTVRGHQ